MKAKSILKNILKVITMGRVVYHGNYNGQKIALTFDDGPNSGVTERIVDILSVNGASATFFVNGTKAEKYPEILKKIVHSKCILANHGYEHKSIKKISSSEYIRGIDKTDSLISEYNVKRNLLFRPPYGDIKLLSLIKILIKKYTVVMWSLDSKDTEIRDSKKLINYFEGIELKNGDIILLHDDYRHTMEALTTIIDIIKSRGFELVTVDELL